MEVGRLAVERYFHVVAAFVGAIARVERLMQVADDVDDEAQRERLRRAADGGVADGGGKRRQRGDGVAFGRRASVGIGLAGGDGDIMVRPGLLLPERVGVRSFEVGPRRRFGDALGAENAADRGAGVGADEPRGDVADYPVPGLAPRHGRRGGDDEEGDHKGAHGHRDARVALRFQDSRHRRPGGRRLTRPHALRTPAR